MILVMLKARGVARGLEPLVPLSHSHTTAEKDKCFHHAVTDQKMDLIMTLSLARRV